MEKFCKHEKLDIPRLAHLHFRVAQEKLQKIGLYKGQPNILFYLIENDGATNAELAKALELKPPTVSVVIGRMCGRDLIFKDESYKLHITQNGKECAEKCKGIFKEVENITYSGFSKEEQELLIGMYTKIEENLKNELGRNE